MQEGLESGSIVHLLDCMERNELKGIWQWEAIGSSFEKLFSLKFVFVGKVVYR